MKKPLYEILQAQSRRPIVIVQATDFSQAYQRASLVLDSLDLPFDPMSENWTIREAAAPFHCAVFADGFFQLMHEAMSTQLH